MSASQIDGPLQDQSARCMPVLRSLPDWFGIESALADYEREIDSLPTFVARGEAGVDGFLSLKRHFPRSAEVYVLGVRPQLHRRGIGRALLDRAESWLRDLGVEYLQVKTLGPSRSDAGYERTRAFYDATGFVPLEEFTMLWSADNPALLLVKRL